MYLWRSDDSFHIFPIYPWFGLLVWTCPSFFFQMSEYIWKASLNYDIIRQRCLVWFVFDLYSPEDLSRNCLILESMNMNRAIFETCCITAVHCILWHKDELLSEIHNNLYLFRHWLIAIREISWRSSLRGPIWLPPNQAYISWPRERTYDFIISFKKCCNLWHFSIFWTGNFRLFTPASKIQKKRR